MSKKLKVFVVGYASSYASFLDDYEITEHMEKADIAIFTGGEDINPKLYGAKAHATTYYTRRDDYEVEAYDILSKLDNIQLIVGICRGAQLMCALEGGLLIQNVHNHAISNGHSMYVPKLDKEMNIVSLHHQMMYPFDMDQSKYEIISYSSNRLSDVYQGDLIDPEKVAVEPEIIIFNGDKKGLAIQGHPEMMDQRSEAVRFINQLIQELCA